MYEGEEAWAIYVFILEDKREKQIDIYTKRNGD